MTRLAHLIAKYEGFYVTGSKPQRYNNPGDLRHSPNAQHAGDPDDIGQYKTPELGWEDLEAQLQKYAKRGLTLAQMIAVYAPGNENNTKAYLQFVAKGLGVSVDTPVALCLLVKDLPNV